MPARQVAPRAIGGPFTSHLSIPEFLNAGAAGLEAIAVVVGASVCRAGWQTPPFARSVELETLTRSLAGARGAAMRRLELEAERFGAAGVVGIRLERSPARVGRPRQQRGVEFVATGTAVRVVDGGPSVPGGVPFTTEMGGADLWALHRAGYRPLGLVMGNCVFHVGYQGPKAWAAQWGRNVEQPLFTQAVAGARELALGRMQDAALALGADVLLGIRLEQKSHGWGGHVLEYFAVGTALIAPDRETVIPPPSLVVSLSDPSPSVPPPPPPKPSADAAETTVDIAVDVAVG